MKQVNEGKKPEIRPVAELATIESRLLMLEHSACRNIGDAQDHIRELSRLCGALLEHVRAARLAQRPAAPADGSVTAAHHEATADAMLRLEARVAKLEAGEQET